MSSHLSKKGIERVGDLFRSFDTVLDNAMGERERFYIAKDCLWFYERFDNLPDGYDSRFFRPLYESFQFFIIKRRYDEAMRIYQNGLSKIELTDLFRHLLHFSQYNQDSALAYKAIMFLDELFNFFSYFGEDEQLLSNSRLSDPSLEPDNGETLVGRLMDDFSLFDRRKDRLLWHLHRCCWPHLLRTFYTCETAYSCRVFIEKLLESLGLLPIEFDKIDDPLDQVKIRFWLLKRQALVMYAALLAESLSPGYWADVENKYTTIAIQDNVTQVYHTYVELLYYSMLKHVHVATDTLNTIVIPKYCLHDVTRSVLARLRKVKNLASDIPQLLSILVGCDSILPKRLLELIESFKNQEDPSVPDSREGAIEWLENVQNQIIVAGANLFGCENVKTTDERLRNRFTVNGQGGINGDNRSFFSSARIRMLVGALDNKFSTETSFFFNDDIVVIDNENSVPTELHILKKWASTGPILEQDKNLMQRRGGGFFLYHHGIGLAIDPGPDFIRNLWHHTDFDLSSVNALVFTHPHYDHYGDFQRIMLAAREFNRNAGYRTIYFSLPGRTAQFVFPPCLRKGNDFYVNISPKNGVSFIPDDDWGRKHGIKITRFPVRHNVFDHTDNTNREGSDRDADRTSFGFRISPMQDGKALFTLAYSGDTEYEADLHKRLSGMRSNGSPSPTDLVILNCGSFRLNDVVAMQTQPEKPLEKRVKKNHLGYSGALSVLKNLSDYKAAILQEFFESQSERDVRLLITRALAADLGSGYRGNLLAGETGLRFRVATSGELSIFCSSLCARHVEGSNDLHGFLPLNEEFQQLAHATLSRHDDLKIACKDCREWKEKLGWQTF